MEIKHLSVSVNNMLKIQLCINWRQAREESANKIEDNVKESANKVKENADDVFLVRRYSILGWSEADYIIRVGKEIFLCIRGVDSFNNKKEKHSKEKKRFTFMNIAEKTDYLMWYIRWRLSVEEICELAHYPHECIELPFEWHTMDDEQFYLRTRFFKETMEEFMTKDDEVRGIKKEERFRTMKLIQWKFLCRDVLSGLCYLDDCGYKIADYFIVEEHDRFLVIPFIIDNIESGYTQIFVRNVIAFLSEERSRMEHKAIKTFLISFASEDLEAFGCFIDEIYKNTNLKDDDFIQIEGKVNLKDALNPDGNYKSETFKYTLQGLSVSLVENLVEVDRSCEEIFIMNDKYDIITNDSFVGYEKEKCLQFMKIKKSDNFEVGKRLGRGGYANVHLCESDPRYALKLFYFKSKSSTISFIKEIASFNCLLKQSHPNVVKLYDYFINTKAENKFCFQMEFMGGGSLRSILKSTGLPYMDVLRYLADIVNGLAFLHSKGVIHFDIKCDNVLITADRTRCKLTDFGLSKRLMNQTNDDQRNSTVHIMAPELFTEDIKIFNFSSDIWSLGITIIEMATGKFPYEDVFTDIELMRKMGEYKQVEYDDREESLEGRITDKDFLNKLSCKQDQYDNRQVSLLQDLVAPCIKKNPEERITANDLLNKLSRDPYNIDVNGITN